MAVRTWVGRFTIIQGQPQEEGPWLRSFPRQRPDEEADELFVLAEPALPGSEEFCGGLVDAVGRLYREDTLSLTGAVLRALQGAHQQLRDWNQRSLRQHWVAAGVSCLVLRGRVAYLAQAGPSVAYHVGDGRFRRIAPEDGASEPVGLPEMLQPVFSRYQLSPGDALLIASPRLGELVDEEILRGALLRGAKDALPQLFRLVREQQDFALLLLACVVEPEEAEAPPVPPPPTAEAPAPAVPGPAAPAVEASAAAPTDELAQEAAARPAPGPPPGGEPPAEPAPNVDLAEVKVRLRGADADIRYPRTTGLLSGLPRIPPLALAAVILLALVGLGAWYIVPRALEESREERFTRLLEGAEAAMLDTEAAKDPARRRELLRAAEKDLAEAAQLRPNDPQVRERDARLATALAELDAVLQLPEPQLVVNLSERVPGPLSVSELAQGGGGAYLLDREQRRVIAVGLFTPSPEPLVIFQAGTLVGTEVVGQPRHIAWADGLNALLMMDDARRLLALRVGAPPRLLAVRDAAAWSSQDGIAYAGGNLYVLDREGDQVWRYLPSESGFDSEREPLLASVDLEDVLQIAVGDALYLLMEDGTIHRFQGGQEQPFPLAGIDKGLIDPASLVHLPANQRLLVVDRGNKRVVVASPDGAFRQQLVHPSFTDLRAVAVDETNGLLYILVGASLLRLQLPPFP